jgi:hypothetical protein
MVGLHQVWEEEKLFMACVSCGSEEQTEFRAEMVIHFPGRAGLDKPVVPVFPKVAICFRCGSTQFAVPEAELRRLEEGIAA